MNYSNLSETIRNFRKTPGVPTYLLGMIPGRVTYFVNKEGKVIRLFNSQTQVEKHVTEALEVLKKIE